MSTKIFYVCIEYSVCNVINGVISCYVWSCDTGKTKFMIKSRLTDWEPGKQRIWKWKKFLH